MQTHCCGPGMFPSLDLPYVNFSNKLLPSVGSPYVCEALILACFCCHLYHVSMQSGPHFLWSSFIGLADQSPEYWLCCHMCMLCVHRREQKGHCLVFASTMCFDCNLLHSTHCKAAAAYQGVQQPISRLCTAWASRIDDLCSFDSEKCKQVAS